MFKVIDFDSTWFITNCYHKAVKAAEDRYRSLLGTELEDFTCIQGLSGRVIWRKFKGWTIKESYIGFVATHDEFFSGEPEWQLNATTIFEIVEMIQDKE